MKYRVNAKLIVQETRACRMNRVKYLRPVARPARGFTLIEIMVVVVILGILGALIVPNFIGRPDEARVEAAKSDILSIANALELYRLDNSNYPSTKI
jgi:general secretion pathway protein G